MAISDDWTIDYTNKTVKHSAGTTVYQMYELYAWLMDEVDESTTIDDAVPMTAQTPTAYTLTNRWFIDHTSIQFLTGGSLKTSGWSASANDDGIRVLTFAGAYTNAVGTDIGKGVTQATSGHTGTLLDYNNTTQKWWVRVDDTGDDFNTTNNITVDAGTGQGIISTGSNLTGETIWTNLYTLGTLVDNTRIYVIQDEVVVTDWWSDGHIDILLAVKEGGVLIDNGYLTVLARQYSTLHDHYDADFSAGARTPVPLAAFDDGNNDNGYDLLNCSLGSGTFTVGEVIGNNATQSSATALGIVTAVAGTTGDPDLDVYYVGDLSEFTGSDTVYGYSSSAQADVDTVGTAGPADTAGVTITFTSTTADLNNGNGSQPYDVTIECNSNTLADVYEYLKYVIRRGSATIFSGIGHSEDGEEYTAVGESYLTYESLTNTFTAGNTVTGGTSGAVGIIVSDHASANLVVREVVGTFEVGESITEGTASATISAGGVENIAVNKQAPFGVFAGGKFFGARGVLITGYLAGDANNFVLIDATNTTQNPPQTVAITVSNTANLDKVAIFKTTGDNETIDKSQYTSHATNNSGSSTSYEVDAATPILADTPSAGYIRIVNTGTNIEERIAFSSWTGNVFSLDSAHAGGYDGTDSAYVPYVDEVATGSSVSESIVYVSDRYVLTRVRIVGMLPFKIKGQITTAGLPVTVIRTSDSIYQ